MIVGLRLWALGEFVLVLCISGRGRQILRFDAGAPPKVLEKTQRETSFSPGDHGGVPDAGREQQRRQQQEEQEWGAARASHGALGTGRPPEAVGGSGPGRAGWSAERQADGRGGSREPRGRYKG